MKKRETLGKIRVKVLGVKRDMKAEKTVLVVIQCERLEVLQ
jgi:hypothetical protein